MISTLFLLPAITVAYCYFDGGNLAAIMNYNDINYDKIFVISLIVSAIPTFAIETKRIIKKYRKAKLKTVQ